MKTEATSSPSHAAKFIRAGAIAAFPTETVYGLGACAFDERAVKKIFQAKGRPQDNPIIVHIYSKKQLPLVASKITPSAKKLINRFFPGPISIVLPKSKKIPKIVTGGLRTVCIRMPSLLLARKFLRECGCPVAAPSANISGRPSPTTYQHVRDDLGGKIPVILKGPPCRHGLESTVIDCTRATPRLLRAGSLSIEEIEKAVGKIELPAKLKKALSPGMKYRHYAPNAKVVIVKNAEEAKKKSGKNGNFAFIGFDAAKSAKMSMACKNKKQYAKSLFSFFRKCDDKKISVIYAQAVPSIGIGRAIMERLRKASSKR